MLAVITLLSLFAFAVSAAVTVAFYMGVAYLGGKLFGPDVPEADAGVTPNAQSRSWNPRSTQQEGISRPRAYGENMHHGNIVAKWTDVDGDEREVLYIIIEHGDGPTEGVVYVDGIAQIFLNDQPAGNFGDSVDVQERLGTNDQTVMTGFEKTKLEYSLSNELILNEAITFTTPNDFFDDIEYTIMWPNGLRKYHKSGGMDYSSSTVKVRIREHPSGGWTEIFNSAVTVRQVAPLFKLYKVNTLSPGYVERGKQYDLEFTNLSGPSERHINDVYVRSVREVVDVGFERPGKALVGIRAVATAKLSGQLDVKIVRKDRLINVYNGSTWSIEYSRNRSWVVYDAFTQPIIDGDGSSGTPFVIDHYEGIDPSRLDLEFFFNWASFCSDQVPDGFGGTEDRIACNTILDFQTSVWKFTNELARIGRASLYWRGHTLTGWVDKEVSEITALVTMDNIMARTWKNAWTEKDELAGRVEVLFNDSRQGYERIPASLPNENAGKYTKIISIEGVGITTHGVAIHFANYLLERNRLIRNVNKFRQYKDGFRHKLGDVIRIQHKTPSWGTAYRVTGSTANNKVTLDRACDAVADELLYVQSYDEALEKVRVDSYTVLSVSDKVVTIVETWNVTPLKNYMVAIGATGDIQTRRIIKIDSTADNYFDVTVETYDTELFDADDLDPDSPNQNYTWGAPANPLVRPVTRDDVIELINKLAMPQADVDTPVTSNLTWSGNSVDTVTWAKTDASEAIIFRYKGTDYEITADSTTAEFIYWDPAYNTIFRTTNVLSTAFTLGKWVMCRNKDGVAYPATPIAIMHGGIIQAGTIIASQIIITGINALDLLNGPAEAGADVTGGRLALIASSMLPNWRLDIADLTGRPAGIYPTDSITDFDQMDWLDSGEAEIKILSTPDVSVGYGFPAIPIDDKQKYKIIIRHKSSAASTDGLYLRIDQYNLPLPVGKTHIGSSTGGANTQNKTNQADLLTNAAMPGTSWVVDEFTYTPTAGTKYGTFRMHVLSPNTAEVEYHVDYVLMFLIPKTADEVDETGSRKWAGESGADITGDHEGDISIENITDGTVYKKWLNTERTKLTGIDTGADVTGDNVAASITGQGALATKGSVALNTGEVTNKSLANLDSSASTKLGGIETSADVTGTHTAANISGQGALATKGSVALNTGEVTNKSLANLDSSANTKLGTIETSADVTADHADEVIYRGNTPPAHKAGRVWYCLVNGSYDNYTLYKSTGSAWEKIGDETAQHQADVQLANLGEKSLTSLDDRSLANLDSGANTKLGGIETSADVTGAHQADVNLANLGEKSVDSLVDGSTYARMLKAWRHTSDTSKMDLSLGFAASISSAQIGLLAVEFAHIKNLAVDTIKIADDATSIHNSVSAWAEIDGMRWSTITTLNHTSDGAAVNINTTLQARYKYGGNWFSVRLVRGAVVLDEVTKDIGSDPSDDYVSFSLSAVDIPGSGAQTYLIQGWCATNGNPCRFSESNMAAAESKGK